MKTRIFDIQRGSFVDGPGIRTIIFFQGCNLRCEWCHNPESWEAKTRLMVFGNRCTHCGACAQVCPAHAISPEGVTDRSICVLCGACVEACPNNARSLCGRQAETSELVQIALKDRDYYQKSGGGVTVSGGECMLQIDALEALLAMLHENGVDTAVDTAGNVPWTFFERILPLTDHFLYDLKALTPERHLALTGVGNDLILSNYRRLLQTCAQKVIVRVPVIPGANDTGDEMEKICAFLNQYPPAKTEFMPYHRLGEGKNAALGQSVFTAETPSKARIDALYRMCGVKN